MNRHIIPRLTSGLMILLLAGCVAGSATGTAPASSAPSDKALAEQFITAFYSWDAAALDDLMLPSPEASNALYYQAWAEAANYAIKQRRPCTTIGSDYPHIECRITVTDDFGAALGYTATDTFTLAFKDQKVANVTFAGDDPPVFAEVFDWLSTTQPELFTGVCKDLFAGGTQPAECARAIASGARAWADAHPNNPQ